MNAIAADFGITPVSGQTGSLERRACEENWEVLLSAFLDSQDIRQTSRETYYWGMVTYFRWMEIHGKIMKAMTPADVMSFKNYMIKEKLSPLTIASYLTAVRRFYAWTENTMLYPNIARSLNDLAFKYDSSSEASSSSRCIFLNPFFPLGGLTDLAMFG